MGEAESARMLGEFCELEKRRCEAEIARILPKRQKCSKRVEEISTRLSHIQKQIETLERTGP